MRPNSSSLPTRRGWYRQRTISAQSRRWQSLARRILRSQKVAGSVRLRRTQKRGKKASGKPQTSVSVTRCRYVVREDLGRESGIGAARRELGFKPCLEHSLPGVKDFTILGLAYKLRYTAFWNIHFLLPYQSQRVGIYEISVR